MHWNLSSKSTGNCCDALCSFYIRRRLLCVVCSVYLFRKNVTHTRANSTWLTCVHAFVHIACHIPSHFGVMSIACVKLWMYSRIFNDRNGTYRDRAHLPACTFSNKHCLKYTSNQVGWTNTFTWSLRSHTHKLKIGCQWIRGSA